MTDASRWRHPETLDDLFLFRLAQLQSVAGSMVVRLCEGSFGITRREWRLLLILAQEDELSSSSLAEHAQLDRTRTSRAISSMVNKKLVVRRSLPGDGRRTLVALTPEGQALHLKVLPRVADINRDVLAGLTDPDAEKLIGLLDVLIVHSRNLAAHMDLPKAGRGRKRTDPPRP